MFSHNETSGCCLAFPKNSKLLTLNLRKFLNGIIHLFLALSIILLGITRWELEAGQPTVEPDVQACLALYWWERLITSGSGRIVVKSLFLP